MVMLWEYFALIFVRARSSIVFFSRSAALSFFAFHVYFYHFQMGYFRIAAAAVFCAMLAVKLYVLRAIELPAFMSGDVSHEQPRAHYVELPCESIYRGSLFFRRYHYDHLECCNILNILFGHLECSA